MQSSSSQRQSPQEPLQKRPPEKNGIKNDLPMATLDALEARAESTLDPSIFPDELLKRIEALETKFRTLQTRCNSVLAMQSQIEALLNELKIRMRGNVIGPKKARVK
jgi:hypothetical protein